jgi:hypothetical protein
VREENEVIKPRSEERQEENKKVAYRKEEFE